MDNQDQGRTHTQGHENHGVHLCHKCGWPFPNPHPSAKHRRAHKKICGTIEGYELLATEGQTHFNPSDDDHLSDDDHKRQAAEESQSILKSRNDVQMENPKILQTERVEDGNMLELQGQPSSSTVNPLESSIADLKTEELIGVHTNDCFGLTSDSKPSKSEAMSHVLLENKIYTDENVRVCSSTSVAMETTLKEEDEIKSDRDMVEIVVSSDNTVAETFEGLSKIAVSDVVNSNYQVADGAFNLKEKNNAELPSVMPQDDLPLEVDSAKSISASINGIRVESAQMIELATCSDVKMLQEREEGNVHVLTPPSCDDRPDVAHPQSEYEDHEGVVSQNSSSLHSSKALEQERDGLKVSVTKENDFLINQGQLSEKREVLSQDMHALDSNMKKEQVNCELMTEEMHAEENIEVSSVTFKVESNKILDETGASKNAMKTEMTGSHMVCFSEEQGSDDFPKISEQVNVPEGTFMADSSENPGDASFGSAASETTTVISRDSTSHHEKNITGINDIAVEGLGRDHSSLSSLNIEPSAQHVSAVEDIRDGEPGSELPGVVAVHVQDQSGNNDVKLASTKIDTSVDPGSRCDSLEANWGSVSVLSVQSDAQGATEAEALPSTDLLASTEASKSNLKDPEAESERQQCEKIEIFEPPSFMTLVEPGHMVGPKPAASENQTELNKQHRDSSSSQAGWFPTLTHVTNESPGRKKNEEKIAKVTNWSTSKQQNTPLKSLFGEAAHNSSKPKSPKLEKHSVNQKNVKVTEDDGSRLTTVNSNLGRKSAGAQAVNGESGKEWNSPADIKREKKKKAKSRPHWIQLLCCSSVDTQ